jgi:hypothetical protein
MEDSKKPKPDKASEALNVVPQYGSATQILRMELGYVRFRADVVVPIDGKDVEGSWKAIIQPATSTTKARLSNVACWLERHPLAGLVVVFRLRDEGAASRIETPRMVPIANVVGFDELPASLKAVK